MNYEVVTYGDPVLRRKAEPVTVFDDALRRLAVRGDGIELRSGFAGCDARTRRVMHWMVDPQSGRPWASAEAVVVSFDLDKRKVVDISEEAQAAYRAASPAGLAL